MSGRGEKSANEIEALFFKAARGGDIPLGHAEDLAAAVPFMNLGAIAQCPCSGPEPLAVFAVTALDLVAAGEGPKVVHGDKAVISALVAAYETRIGRKLAWRWIKDGAIIEKFDAGCVAHEVLGRRHIPDALATHLADMAARRLVPETQESRLGGAGAGLTDND